MPAKRSARARDAAVATAKAEESAYDVASLPMDDAAATSPQPLNLLSPSQKRARQESSPSPLRARAAPSAEAAGEAASAQNVDATLGEADKASLAETSLQALVDPSVGAAGGATTAMSLATVADTILAVYRIGDKEQALCAVLNVLSKAAGVAEVELDANALVDGVEIRPLLEELYARVPADSEAYLLVNKDAKYRRFRRTFPEWCAALIQGAFSLDILLDATFLPVLSQWIIAMSESKSRSFRHTATVALLAVVHALSGIAADLQNQLSLLRAKKDITAVQIKRDDVVEWRDHVFSQAVHQRLRDVAPDIRLAGFQALRRWILEFPDEFMTNKYLRYLGMPLHDKRPELRAEALDTILQALASVSDAYSRMQLFLQYFTGRLVELSNDVDVRCTELAIRVVAMMVRGDSDAPQGSELLSNEKIDQVLLTLFDERPTVRTAAGVLLKVFIHCRTAGEESEAEQVSVATELLCSFAATLRSQYREAMPEKYLVDALWTPERPPVLLTEYAPILAAAQSDKPLDAVVGLQLLAALLLKVQGRLTLGPVPKDDRRGSAAAPGGAKKISLKAKNEAAVLQRRISEDAVLALCPILEVHRGSEDVLQATAAVCAALDMPTFTSQRHHTALSALLVELRKATFLSSCVALETRECLVKAWLRFAFTDHPLREEAQAHLQELRKNAVAEFQRAVTRSSQASQRGEATLAAWARLNLVSALVSTHEQWPQLQAAFTGVLTAQPTADANLALIVAGTGVQSLLWHVKEMTEEKALLEQQQQQQQQPGTAQHALDAHVKGVVTALFHYEVKEEETAEAFSANASVSADVAAVDVRRTVPVVEVFLCLCDVLALPYFDMSQVQQETLLRLLRTLHEHTATELRTAHDYLKLHVQEHRMQQQQHCGNAASGPAGASAQVPSVVGLAELTAARYACSRLEALQLRLVTSVARLFLYKRLDSNALAAPFLALWTQSPSKTVADTFKSLFHTLRERSGDDGFALERDILLSAYTRCAEVGATPVSVEALYQTGLKLASLHFVGTDRFYPCCPAMVQFGADFAISTDPLILQAVTPYASKLRPADALQVLRDQLSRNTIFVEATNAYVRTFVAALRKAAKLEDSNSSLTLGGSAGRKRSHALADGGSDEVTELPEGEETGAESTAMVAAMTRGQQPQASAKGQRISVASRVVTADGWHVAASHGTSQDEDAIEVDMSQQDSPLQQHQQRQQPDVASAQRTHRSIVNVPTSQEVALSSLADGLGSDEVFVATEEFE